MAANSALVKRSARPRCGLFRAVYSSKRETRCCAWRISAKEGSAAGDGIESTVIASVNLDFLGGEAIVGDSRARSWGRGIVLRIDSAVREQSVESHGGLECGISGL